MTTLAAGRYQADAGDVSINGVQALVRLPLNVRRADRFHGRRTAAFVSGYEGSPLGGYDLELARCGDQLAELDITFRPALNEELAATAVQGTQLVAESPDARVDGVTGFWYGKSPGLDRAIDALRHANLMGTHPNGGAVALVGDDPAAKSSTVPGASESVLADLGVPVLYPADAQDVLDLGMHAVAMSRASGLWVGLKIVTNVADGTRRVRVDWDRVKPVVPQLAGRGSRFEHRVSARMVQPFLSEMEASRDGIRLDVARAYARVNAVNRVEEIGHEPRVGIVAAGTAYLDLRQALAKLGLASPGGPGLRVLKLGMIHPLVPEEIIAFADGLDQVIVIEEKRPFVESAIKQMLYGTANAPLVVGKTQRDGRPLFSHRDHLDADTIADGLASCLVDRPEFPAIAEKVAPRAARRAPLPLIATRTPYFCSGCPHNRSTQVPEGTVVGGGIGCHALVMVMRPDAVGDVLGLTQMGGEGAQWIGMAPFRKTQKHLVQNLGDGTFHHSGSLAVRAAIAAGVDITFKLLYNGAVAMTGGQAPVGVMPIPGLTDMLRAEGVRRIIITTTDVKAYRRQRLHPSVEVWSRDRLADAQETLGRLPGVTVLIHDQECATELRRKRKRGLLPEPVEHVMINERVCEGCGDCGRKSNCLSVQPVESEFGRKTRIDHSSCNLDYSCLDGDCPSFLSVVPSRARQAGASAPELGADVLPEPPSLPSTGRAHTTRITGIGGSGVLTLSQVLATAAVLAGRDVRSLDQTGLAQKGGAVVSDVKISAEPVELSHKASAGECDLYLGCDLLVAADAANLAVGDPARTVAVVSTSPVPTGAMVVDPAAQFPNVPATVSRIGASTRADRSVFVDARGMSRTLFGTDQYANVFLVGVALQTGALPLPAQAIEEAMELNGVQAATNVQAFRRGRQFVADPTAFAADLEVLAGPPARERSLTTSERDLIGLVKPDPGSELERLLTVRVPDLVAYQNAGYAERYALFVARVREAERLRGTGSAVSEAVARHLYKLMTYKDEYEVARLSLDPTVTAAVRSQFGSGARVAYRLHPPLLRALGLKHKIAFGPWFRQVFGILYGLRVLRGTKLDPFGHARVRRVERALIGEYRALIEAQLPRLDESTVESIAELASLPDLIRGFEGVKLANVERYRAELAEVTGRLNRER